MIARNREEGSKSAYIGAACYPTLAMFNHSCDPSIIRFYIEGLVHQILSPISNSESTNFFKRIFIKISFSTCKMRKKNPSFEAIKSLFSFSTAQTEKNSWKKIRETNW